MSANYPGADPSFTPIVDGVDYPQAVHINSLQDEIIAIGSDLRTDGLAHDLKPDATANARALGASTQRWGLAYVKGLTLGTLTELTIASGAITATPGCVTVDTESNAASDDLDTITAGTGVADGSLLYVHAEDVSRVVTLKDGTGNLLLNGDYALSATDRTITLRYDGTNWREVCRSVTTGTTNPVYVLDRDVAVATVSNTVTETAVYSYSVPGGTLGSTKALRLTVIGDYLNDTGSSRDITVRAKYGTTTVFSGTPTSLTTSATRRPVRFTLDLSALNATNAQAASGRLFIGNNVGVAGVAGVAASGADLVGHHVAVAEDSTGALTLQVTIEHSTNSASLTFRAHTVTLEYLS